MGLPENAQTIAGLVALVSVALLTVQVPILRALWGKLDTYLFGIPLEKRRNLGKVVLFTIGIPVILMGVYTAAGVYDPKNVNAYIFVVIFLITFVLVVSLIIGGSISLIKGKKEKKVREKVETLPLLFVTGSIFFVIGILCNLFALFGVSAAMLDIRVGIYSVENYNWGRWIMMDAIYFFFTGMWAVGFGYAYEKIERRRAANIS